MSANCFDSAETITLPEKQNQRASRVHDPQPHERTKHDDHTDHDNIRPPNRPQKMATHHPQRQRPGPPRPRLPRMRLLAPGRNLHPPRPRQQNLPPPPMPPLRETNDNMGAGKLKSPRHRRKSMSGQATRLKVVIFLTTLGLKWAVFVTTSAHQRHSKPAGELDGVGVLRGGAV